MTQKKLSKVEKEAIKHTRNILLAQRNRDIKTETKHHIKLEDFCIKYGLNFNHVFRQCKKWISENETITASFNGLI